MRYTHQVRGQGRKRGLTHNAEGAKAERRRREGRTLRMVMWRRWRMTARQWRRQAHSTGRCTHMDDRHIAAGKGDHNTSRGDSTWTHKRPSGIGHYSFTHRINPYRDGNNGTNVVRRDLISSAGIDTFRSVMSRACELAQLCRRVQVGHRVAWWIYPARGRPAS